jgi:2-hydroxycyclohexanecarboxyl-CoA dehydrogenase
MIGNLAGKVALVTGGTGGIGRGIALELARCGACVAVNGRDPAKGAAVVADIAALGGQALFVPGDVLVKAEMDAAVAAAVAYFGRLDVVVANAGGNDGEARDPRVRGPFADIDLGRVSRFVGQAVSAKLLVVQAAVPALRASGAGSVVFITSEGGRVPTPMQTAICTFSGGLIMAAKLLSKELAGDGIRVNTVCVTVVRNSPSWDAAFSAPDGVSDRHRRQYEKILAQSPFGVAAPEDIGKLVSFVASDDAHYLTGATLSPTGGLTLH